MEQLTERERQVLQLVANGLSNKSIAKQLCISAKTVENHLRLIYAKLGVSNRAGATALAVAAGLLDIPPKHPSS